MLQLGYACINQTLQKTEKVQCNRGMIKRTFKAKGIAYASELALINVNGLRRVIEWNNAHGIKVYRMTSCLFPWFSEYDMFDLPDINQIADIMADAGRIAMEGGQRLSFHPGPFNVLASPNDSVVTKTIKELNDHSAQMDLMDLPVSPMAKINIHVGGAYGEHDKALARFCDNAVKHLTHSAISRLTVENDDKANLYSTKMLYEGVYQKIGVPIVFDSHHFELGPQDVPYDESFDMAYDSWPSSIRPTCHHSNGKKEYEDNTIRSKAAHSNYYYKPFNSCGKSVDIVLEAKCKEKALMKYKKDFLTNA